MKHSIDCTIETITIPGEDAWIITIAAEDVPHAIILLTALQYGKISQIRLTDHRKTAVICSDSLTLAATAVRITSTWLEALISTLLNVQLNGWNIPAHLDQDFTTANGEICVCFAVAPPQPGSALNEY